MFFRQILFESLINRIFGLSRIFTRPVRDDIWVETKKRPNPRRAVRYGICRNLVVAINHMAYLTARGFLLAFCFLPIYSPYGTGTISEIP